MNIPFNKVSVLLFLTFLIRILCVCVIGKIPCMESNYFTEGKNLIEGIPVIVYLSPFYSTLIYTLTTCLNSLFYASALIFILSSTAVSYYIYAICKLWNERAAYTSLLFTLFIPNLTVSIAGYSHSVILGIALELAAVFYILIYLKKNVFHHLFTAFIFTVLTIFIRPELIIVIIPLYIIMFAYTIFNRGIKHSYKMIGLAGLFFTFLTLSVFTHKLFVKAHNINKNTAGVFTDNTYSYFAFIHVYSLRYFDIIDDHKAINASMPFIGSPETNNYSIATAILKNPVQFGTNVLFNCKEILDNLAHPLFLPFYFYFFIGILFKNPLKPDYIPLSLITILFFLHCIPLVVFHVEVRYMQPLTLLILIVASLGESDLKSKIYRNAAVFFTFIIFMIYLINNKNMASLCG
jgi:hypothetical protein